MSLIGYDARNLEESIVNGQYLKCYANAIWASSNEDDRKKDQKAIKCLKFPGTTDSNVFVCESCRAEYKDTEILDVAEIIKASREECERLSSECELALSQLNREIRLVELYPHDEEQFDIEGFEKNWYDLCLKLECEYERLEMAELEIRIL